jgi:hypothetical protein
MTYILMMKNTDQYGQQWERKRFIGNDIVVIVFYEGKVATHPSAVCVCVCVCVCVLHATWWYVGGTKCEPLFLFLSFFS